MAKQMFKTLFRRVFLSSRKGKNAGFTILELLVATVIATFVIIALLDMIVDLLQTERREYGRSETQREMQMAMDFIVNDVREAAYVYDNPGINRIKAYLPPPIFNGAEPILAFWKPRQINEQDLLPENGGVNCDIFGPAGTDATLKRQECDLLKIRRRAYSLVVYLQAKNVGPDQLKWKGISRIMRYELPKYTDTGVSTLTHTPGYADPQENNVSFSTWPLDQNNAPKQEGTPDGKSDVLVDFLDYPDNPRPDGLIVNPASCPDETSTNPAYSRIPATNTSFNNPSFLVCVSSGSAGSSGSSSAASTNSTNQDVIIFLRGNPTGKGGIKVAPLLAIKTQAVARGVIDKSPQ